MKIKMKKWKQENWITVAVNNTLTRLVFIKRRVTDLEGLHSSKSPQVICMYVVKYVTNPVALTFKHSKFSFLNSIYTHIYLGKKVNFQLVNGDIVCFTEQKKQFCWPIEKKWTKMVVHKRWTNEIKWKKSNL